MANISDYDNQQLFFNAMIEECCFASVLFICTGNQSKKCTAHYKQGVRTFNCNKTHINLRDNRFCRNVLNQIVTMDQQGTLANIKGEQVMNSCNTKNCNDWPCKYKPVPKETVPKETIEVVTVYADPHVEIVRSTMKLDKINNMDTLNLETTNPILYNIWKTKYKNLSCQQINKMFQDKYKKWKASNVSQVETNNDVFEIELDHERKNYADFWAFFEGMTLQNDERIIDKAVQVVVDRPDIFDEYINMHWNNNMREYILGPNYKTFHTWLLDSKYSQVYKYMLEHNVSFKNAKNQFRTGCSTNDKLEKLKQQYIDMMEKEEKACIARLNASNKLLHMTGIEK